MGDTSETAFQRLTALAPFPQPRVVRPAYPVVLMHGFGMFASFRRGGHLHQQAMHLRRHGVLAYAPNVAPYNTVPVRAEMWQERVERILDETGAEKVNLVAQSMGGLDARYLITKRGLHTAVASLVTVSTPHRGTTLCDVIHEQPERLQEWAATVFNWLGTSAMRSVTPDVARAVAELTPSHVCDVFNEQVPDHPSVTYWSYAGAAGKGTDVPISPILRFQNGLIYKREGVNDGFVSVDSARWGTFLGTIAADHGQEVGLDLVAGRAFDANAFYLGIVEKLAAEGF